MVVFSTKLVLCAFQTLSNLLTNPSGTFVLVKVAGKALFPHTKNSLLTVNNALFVLFSEAIEPFPTVKISFKLTLIDCFLFKAEASSLPIPAMLLL